MGKQEIIKRIFCFSIGLSIMSLVILIIYYLIPIIVTEFTFNVNTIDPNFEIIEISLIATSFEATLWLIYICSLIFSTIIVIIGIVISNE